MTTRSESRPQLLYSASNDEDAQTGGKQERKGHGSPETEFEPLPTTTTTTTTTTTSTSTPTTADTDANGDGVSESKGDDENCVNGGGEGGGGGGDSNEAGKTCDASSSLVVAPSSGLQHHFTLDFPRAQLEKLEPELLQVIVDPRHRC